MILAAGCLCQVSGVLYFDWAFWLINRGMRVCGRVGYLGLRASVQSGVFAKPRGRGMLAHKNVAHACHTERDSFYRRRRHLRDERRVSAASAD